MDWKSLTSSFDPLITKLNPLFDSAKNAGYKALDFTQKQMQSTPLVLKTMEEYTLLRTSKRFILLSYDQGDPLAREVLLRSPVWSAQAWSDAAELRFVEISSAPEIVQALGITPPLDMRVWYIGNETFHSKDLEEIKNWWKIRCYDASEIETTKHDEKPKDPKEEGGESLETPNLENQSSGTPQKTVVDPLSEK